LGQNIPSKKVGSTSQSSIPQCGVDLIKEFEGCHLNAYPDPLTGGLPITIGWGSTKDFDGSSFKMGRKITQQYADQLLLHDIKVRFIPSLQKIPHWNEMNEEMQSSLLSFSYNLGANFYASSGFSTITRNLREKDWKSIPKTLELYRNPGSSVEAGLLRRRRAEGKLWNEGLKKLNPLI
jgi:lysozyme